MQKDLGKVHKLQKLLLSSESAKFFAIRRTEERTIEFNKFSSSGMFCVSALEKMNLAINLDLDGEVTSVKKCTQKLNSLQLFATRAKQELALLALIPQWEADFENYNYGFRPGRSIFNALEVVLSILSQRQMWVLQVDVSDCFTTIDHDLLVKKCNTFPTMEKQIKIWLKNNAFDSSQIQTEGISSFLVNVALHGVENLVNKFTSDFLNNDSYNSESIHLIGYGCNFLIFYSDREVLEKVKIRLKFFS